MEQWIPISQNGGKYIPTKFFCTVLGKKYCPHGEYQEVAISRETEKGSEYYIVMEDRLSCWFVAWLKATWWNLRYRIK